MWLRHLRAAPRVARGGPVAAAKGMSHFAVAAFAQTAACHGLHRHGGSLALIYINQAHLGGCY